MKAKMNTVAKPKGKAVSNGDTLSPVLMQFGFEGEPVRMVMQGEMPWFNANDVCKALGYVNPRDAVADHVDEEDRNTVAIRDGIRGNPNKNFINESGLYALIFGSGKPKAKRFKRWVTSEVLPTIRRTGQYRVESAPAKSPLPGDAEFKLGYEMFTRLLYAMDKRLGAAALVWWLLENGALDCWVEASARQIAKEIGQAVKYSTIYKFSGVLADEGVLEYQVGEFNKTTSRYRLNSEALRKALRAVPQDAGRPGLAAQDSGLLLRH